MSAQSIEADAAAAAPKKEGKAGNPFMPALAVIVLVPVVSYFTAQYVLVPKLRSAVSGESVPAAEGHHRPEAGHKKGEAKHEGKGGAHGKEKKGGGTGSYPYSHDFSDVIVNLAGAKGSRYLRVKFTLASTDENIGTIVKANENQLKDLAIGVLSSQTLESLEVAGARNAIRNELMSQFNHALHGELVEQLYFSEFVVQ